ncbi:hypothetical protein M132_2453 [Bacteroides fragilis str. S24L15]|nr:hypothetical protein M132_2453 [Bacteroides fragilis str. S24L15]
MEFCVNFCGECPPPSPPFIIENRLSLKVYCFSFAVHHLKLLSLSGK